MREGMLLVSEGETVVEGESDWLVFGVRGIVQGVSSLGEGQDTDLLVLGLVFKVAGSGAMGVGIRAKELVSCLGEGEAGISWKSWRSGAVVISGKQQHWDPGRPH